MVEWPSGLRRQVKALVSSGARVRIPPQPINIYVCVCAVLAEWSKALRLGRSPFGGVGSNPTGCI